MATRRKYDPEVEEQAAKLPRLDVSDIHGARATLAASLEELAAQGFQRPTDERVDESERLIPGPPGAPDVLVRVYAPRGRTEAGPAFLSIHGGGFMFGDLETEHVRCLALAARGGAVCIGVEYRLAPENPFPTGLEDCYAALVWVVEHAQELKIDPDRIAVGGGSAGGNLAAAVSLLARDRGGPPIAFQMLFYPTTDDRCDTGSMIDSDDLYVWDRRNSLEMWKHYLGAGHAPASPYAAPARAEDLSGLPPAYVLTCEHDPLRDEGIVYAMRLMAAGVPVELHNYPGVVHGFDMMIASAASSRAVDETVEVFKRAMAR